jgi:hypothetical protein
VFILLASAPTGKDRFAHCTPHATQGRSKQAIFDRAPALLELNACRLQAAESFCERMIEAVHERRFRLYAFPLSNVSFPLFDSAALVV